MVGHRSFSVGKNNSSAWHRARQNVFWFVSLSFQPEDGRAAGIIEDVLQLRDSPDTFALYKAVLQKKLDL